MKLLALLSLLLAPLLPQQSAPARPAYAAGQVWEYDSRPEDKGSLLKIQQVETDPAGNPIYHISLIGLQLRGVAGQEAQHLPVSKQTLDASVIRLADTMPAFPDPSEGIAEWRKANGGVFTIPVAGIVDVIEQAIARNE